LPSDQALLDQPPNHHRNRALMGVGAGGQIVDGPGRRFSELLQHEQLGAADAHLLFATPGGAPQYPDDPADRIERSG
jgi:hypothetical protein